MAENDAPERKAAFDKFRRSVGFQFGFVLYSGLEVEKAIGHICSAAERLLADLAAPCRELDSNSSQATHGITSPTLTPEGNDLAKMS